MIVGTCEIECFLPVSQSLKDKRHVLKSLKTRIRNKFNVSVSEIGEKNLWQRATLAIAIVGDDTRFLQKVLSQVLQLVERETYLEIIDSYIDIS
ncbi:MAG: DUF503 domain-containing protein [Gemmatimonadetes bacterium]|nr:MAG: DUF503 domain-containing protein [Gemmatimonadota bacterium]